mmetsp:Transcript_100412/g.288512  ORF Transcript_100412/g.288512 Transcript_100412/m.288512 type:complete len:161 (-) Transcript_100412:26-508(-)
MNPSWEVLPPIVVLGFGICHGLDKNNHQKMPKMDHPNYYFYMVDIPPKFPIFLGIPVNHGRLLVFRKTMSCKSGKWPKKFMRRMMITTTITMKRMIILTTMTMRKKMVRRRIPRDREKRRRRVQVVVLETIKPWETTSWNERRQSLLRVFEGYTRLFDHH